MAIPNRSAGPTVHLRPVVPRDADLLARWRAEPSVRRYQPLSELDVGQLRGDIASHRMPDLYRGRGDKFQWIIEVDGAAAGWLTLVVSNWEHGLAEVGYALSTAWQGRGLMVTALQDLLADLFSRTELERIEARCAIENDGSRKVLERVGFVREGRLRSYFRLHGERVDNYLYAVLKRDYLS